MQEDFVRERLTQLRLQKGISEYKMSLDLGHSRNYMQNISQGRALLPISELLYICEYFGITPKEFFDEGVEHPALIQKTLDNISGMSDEDLILLNELIERWYKPNNKNDRK